MFTCTLSLRRDVADHYLLNRPLQGIPTPISIMLRENYDVLGTNTVGGLTSI